MLDYYAKICLNGHVVIDKTPLLNSEYCEKCGSKMLSKCPDCNSVIKEWHSNMVRSAAIKFEKPLYCRLCGKPYPWTKEALETTYLLIQEDENLSVEEQENVKNSLPDIIAETPKTKLATVRIKKALSSCGKFTAEAIRQFVIDFGCELAKQSLGL